MEGTLARRFGSDLWVPVLMTVAMQHVHASHGGVVLGILPLTTAITSTIILRERPSIGFWICGVLGSAAVVIFSLREGGAPFKQATGCFLVQSSLRPMATSREPRCLRNWVAGKRFVGPCCLGVPSYYQQLSGWVRISRKKSPGRVGLAFSMSPCSANFWDSLPGTKDWRWGSSPSQSDPATDAFLCALLFLAAAGRGYWLGNLSLCGICGWYRSHRQTDGHSTTTEC